MSLLEARGIVKSYVDAAKVLTCCAISTSTSPQVKCSPSSGHRARQKHLLHVLGGLDRAEEGTVAVNGAMLTTLPDPEVVAFRNRARRVRVPVSPPAAGVHRARERRDADAHRPALTV
jgi:predicted ABC-type transport system involved in lysophospholipase L1 biosynthesis ATPase subunit